MNSKYPIPQLHYKSSNTRVREYLTTFLRIVDATINEEQAALLAGKFYGMGQHAFETSQEEWVALFGEEYGKLVYTEMLRVQNEIRYLDVHVELIHS